MLCSGQIVNNIYQVCEEIGSGGMGVVYLAYHLHLDKYVVMKKIKNPRTDLSFLRNEVDILKSLHHPYLPQVYDFFSFDGDLYTVIDYIEGYDLKYYIENGIQVTEGQLIKWLRQLCEVLQYLHTHRPRVLHTDIKPANIIVQPDGDICLIDFGVSMLGETEMKGISYRYSSPEQNYNAECMKNGNDAYLLELDGRTDIYSLGATFYQIVTMAEPSCLYALPPVSDYMWMPISEPLAKIIDKAVAYDREERFTDVSAMLKAIDSMFKLSSKYKTYVVVQTLVSVVACIMILLGGFLIIDSVNSGVKASFEQDYNTYLSALKRNDTVQASETAKKLINKQEYRDLLDREITAEVYHGLGNCYYYAGDCYNAEDCYKKALELSDTYDRENILYCDCALAMIENGHINDAYALLDQLNTRHPDSPSGFLILSQLKLKENQIAQAKELIEKAIVNAHDADTQRQAYLMQGDYYVHEGDYSAAVSAYQSARAVGEDAVILRKLGSVQLKLASANNNSSAYQNALDTFRAIYDRYVPEEDDVFNLAQCYLLSGSGNGATDCIKIMKAFVQEHPESCKAYIMLAIASDAAADGNTASYCRSAHQIYAGLSAAEKSKIDGESLNSIRALYKKYTKEVW